MLISSPCPLSHVLAYHNEQTGITPIQKLTNTVSDLSHLGVWGCTAYLRLPEETLVKSENLYPTSKKHSFVGYDSLYGCYGMDIRLFAPKMLPLMKVVILHLIC